MTISSRPTKLSFLDYDRNNLGQGIDPAKTTNSKEWVFCQYWYFNYRLKYRDSVCYNFHDLLMLCVNIIDVTVIAVKRVSI